MIEYTLINGDCLDASLIESSSMDLIITSPPYNIGMEYDIADDTISYDDYLDFSRSWLKNAYNWTRDTGRLCLNIGLDKTKQGKEPLAADLTRAAMDSGWNYQATIIWLEGNISKGTAWGSWLSARAPHIISPAEIILVLYKKEWRRQEQGESTITSDEFSEWVRGIWEFKGARSTLIGHVAPYPRELVRRCIKLFSYKGDKVLDPFAGSGTTLIETIEQERLAYGIELSSQYCALAHARINKESPPKLL